MTEALLKSAAWAAFKGGFAQGLPCVLAFDFDGTLAPIVAAPGLARLEPGLGRRLAGLSRLQGVRVAVLSGRGMADLRRKAPVPGLTLFSNHGLDCSKRRLAPPASLKRRWRRLARLARARLEPLLPGAPGAMLEDKGLDLSLHVRAMRPSARPAVLRRARRALRGLPLRLRPGKLSLEIRPRAAVDKGKALLRLLAGGGRAALCLFAGDDRTDEDAFRAMRALKQRGLSVKVGPGPSAARARIARAGLSRLLAEIGHTPRLKGGSPWI